MPPAWAFELTPVPLSSRLVPQVQPFRYTLLLWASLLGWLVFSEVPDGPTIAGSILLVGAGYCNVQLEHARGKTKGPSSDGAANQEQASDAKAQHGGATALV